MAMNCTVCGARAIGRGLCRRHYQQAWKAGELDAHVGERELITVKDRLLTKIKVTDTGCWEWTGFRKPEKFDYGYIWVKGRNKKAHRVSYEVHKGPIPAGIDVLHKCDNPPCINPDHLFLGTRGDNCRDCASKNRFPLNAAHWNMKLSVADVDFIRSSGATNAELALKFGVGKTAISRVRTGERRAKAHVA